MELDRAFPAPVLDFSEAIGELAHYWGFKKVHGKIWAHLYLSGEALDALVIRQRLKISKALVSISVRDLMKYGMIREAGKSPRGTILYEAISDMRTPICNILKNREKKMLEQLSSSFKSICSLSDGHKKEMKLCPNRLESLGRMVGHANAAFSQLLGEV